MTSILLLIGPILLQSIQMQISTKQNMFSEFSLHILNLDQIFSIFQKRMTLIADNSGIMDSERRD